MNYKAKFNTVSEPASLPEEIDLLQAHITAAQNPKASLQKRRDHLRKALRRTERMIAIFVRGLNKDGPAEKNVWKNSLPLHDKLLEEELKDYTRPDANFLRHARWAYQKHITDAGKEAKKLQALAEPDAEKMQEAKRLGTFELEKTYQMEDLNLAASKVICALFLADGKIAQMAYFSPRNAPEKKKINTGNAPA